MSRILPTPLVFISGYANTENVFYCLTSLKVFLLASEWLTSILQFRNTFSKKNGIQKTKTLTANTKRQREKLSVKALYSAICRQEEKFPDGIFLSSAQGWYLYYYNKGDKDLIAFIISLLV